MSDHVKEALSKHDKAETDYDPEWESWIAGEVATFFRAVHPDETAFNAGLAEWAEDGGDDRLIWKGTRLKTFSPT